MGRDLIESALASLCGDTATPSAPQPAVKASQPIRVQRENIQYIKRGNSFCPAGPVELVSALPAGSYQLEVTPAGPLFTLRESKTDELYLFKGSRMDLVAEEIKRFWTLKENFKTLGYMHNRGILMYGPPGTGKSSLIQQVSEAMIKQGDLVLFTKRISSTIECLKAMREVESERRVVVVFEDVDEHAKYEEHALLQLLDGENVVDNILYLGTTNYIDRFPPRLLRPGRFDKTVKIDFPPVEGRLVYLQKKLSLVEKPERISELARMTEGMSFGHLREFVIACYCFKEPVSETIRRLKQVTYTELPDREPKMVESALAKLNRKPVLKG